MSQHYDVAISYRRYDGSELSNFIRSKLEADGWSVFQDVRSLPAGPFPSAISDAIKDATNFLPVLTKGSFTGQTRESDWYLKEIALALYLKKNIVPVSAPEFEFPKKEEIEHLSDDERGVIDSLSRYHVIPYYHVYADEAVTATIARLHGQRSAAGLARESSKGIEQNFPDKAKVNFTVRRIIAINEFRYDVYFDNLFIYQGSTGVVKQFSVECVPGTHVIEIRPSNPFFKAMVRLNASLFLKPDNKVNIAVPLARDYDVVLTNSRISGLWGVASSKEG